MDCEFFVADLPNYYMVIYSSASIVFDDFWSFGYIGVIDNSRLRHWVELDCI